MTMKKLLTTAIAASFLIGGFAVTNTVLAVPAAAQLTNAKQIVDEAKASGVVGETVAGYLALVNGTASPKIVDAMNEINIRRKSVYTAKARQQSVAIEVVAALTGEKVIAKAKPGEKILNAAGKWVSAG